CGVDGIHATPDSQQEAIVRRCRCHIFLRLLPVSYYHPRIYGCLVLSPFYIAVADNTDIKKAGAG
ncbi:hypothetical protein ACMA55_004794, partial [Salmonella enterica subsp. enterica serovar Newport]